MTPQEYSDCVELFADPLYRFTLKTVADKELAKDIVQDCYTKVWERRREVHFATVKAYLFKSAYNAAIDHFRKDKKKLSTEVSTLNHLKVEQPSADLPEILNKAVMRLSAQQRSILLLRDYEGYSYEEIAKITELSLEQVKVYLFRARKYLRNYLVNMEAIL